MVSCFQVHKEINLSHSLWSTERKTNPLIIRDYRAPSTGMSQDCNSCIFRTAAFSYCLCTTKNSSDCDGYSHDPSV